MRLARVLLQSEGVAVTIAAIWAYSAQTDSSWLLLFALWLVPDVGLLGFLAGTRVGAIAYNVTHSALGPLAVIGLGVGLEEERVLALGLIWATHVGVDRAVGYGLKSSWSAKHTHLQQLTDPRGADGEAAA